MKRAKQLIDSRTQPLNIQNKPTTEQDEHEIEYDDPIPFLVEYMETSLAIVFHMSHKLVQVDFHENDKTLMFDAIRKSVTIIDKIYDQKVSIDLDFLMNGNLSDKMQSYIATSMKYISLLNIGADKQ